MSFRDQLNTSVMEDKPKRRPRTIRTMIARLNHAPLVELWSLKSMRWNRSQDRKLIRDHIRKAVGTIRESRWSDRID